MQIRELSRISPGTVDALVPQMVIGPGSLWFLQTGILRKLIDPIQNFSYDDFMVAEDQLTQLVDLIEQNIAVRGVYCLMDERLDLICGRNTLQNIDSPTVARRITQFAASHGWTATRSQSGFLFLPTVGEINFFEFEP